MSYLKQEVLVRNTELTSYHQKEELEKSQKEREDSSPYVLPTSQTLSHLNTSWLSAAHTTRKDPESEWLATDNLETNPITIKPETASHMAEQFSWFPYPAALHLALSQYSLLLSAHVSPWTFLSLRQEPTLGPWKRSPFLPQNNHFMAIPMLRKIIQKTGVYIKP